MRAIGSVLAALAFGAGSQASALPPAGADCAYVVRLLDPKPARLAVDIDCRNNGVYRLRGWRHVPNDHVSNVTAGPGTTLDREPHAWLLRASGEEPGGSLQARYVLDMEGLASTTRSHVIGRYVGRSLVTSPTSFLLMPERRGLRIALRFETPRGTTVSTGFPRNGDWQHFATDDFARTGYVVMGHYARREIRLPGPGAMSPDGTGGSGEGNQAIIELAIADEPMDMGADALAAWVRTFALETAKYWHGFPVRRALVVLRPVGSSGGLFRGHVLSGGGATLFLVIGEHSERQRLDRHWMLTHELSHFGSPHIADGHRWFSEGMAVYVEALVRARGGYVDPTRLWRGWYENLHKGVPTLEGGGLRTARGVAPVYWGGALVMMMADVEIRRRTDNRFSLDDCLRGVLRAGGDATAVRTIDRIVAACDAATGVPVMAGLMHRYMNGGAAVDIDAMWRDLGVSMHDGDVAFDDSAPLAHVRRAMISVQTPD